MSTTADLPATAKLLNNPQGNGVYQGDIDEKGRRHVLSWKVPWEDHNDFLETAGGTPVVFTSGGSSVTVMVPLKFPYADNMYAKRITYRGEGSDKLVDDARLYPWVIVTVEFGTFDYAVESATPFLTIRYRASASFATIPNVPFRFGTGEKLGQDVGVLVGEYAIEVTRHRVADLGSLIAILKPLVGMVSSTSITIDGVTYAAGTLHFPTFEGTEQTFVLGNSQQELSYAVLYRSIPWNSALRSDGVVDVLIPAPYPTADMTSLFS